MMQRQNSTSDTSKIMLKVDAVTTKPNYLCYSEQLPPFIATCGITDCVGIGLTYQLNGKTKKIALYHSFSEHGTVETDSIREILKHQPSIDKCRQVFFINSIYDFLQDIERTEDINVIAHFNRRCYTADNLDHKIYDLHKFLKNICACLNKKEIPLANVNSTMGNGVFSLTSSGNYYSLNSDENIEQFCKEICMTLCEKIASTKFDSHLLVSTECNGKKYSTPRIIAEILRAINQANEEKIPYRTACHEIFKLIDNDIKKSHSLLGSIFHYHTNQTRLLMEEILPLMKTIEEDISRSGLSAYKPIY
jgi:hypothetical protein